MNRGTSAEAVILALAIWGCSWNPHVGSPITDPSDPGFLDLSKKAHAISPWFEYEVRGPNRSLVFFHKLENGEREALGEIVVDGFWYSVNEREAAFAISEDGRTLLYLHCTLLHQFGGPAPGDKPGGLYDPNARGPNGTTPLHLAQSSEMADLLLAHGARPDARTHDDQTPAILHQTERAERERR